MNEETKEALRREFGYVPDESREKWCVYRDHTLIVVDPERLPRLYRRGDLGVYYEIDLNFP